MKFELEEKMVQVIALALGEIPYKIAAPVINELQRQIDAQQSKPPENKPAEDPPPAEELKDAA